MIHIIQDTKGRDFLSRYKSQTNKIQMEIIKYISLLSRWDHSRSFFFFFSIFVQREDTCTFLWLTADLLDAPLFSLVHFTNKRGGSVPFSPSQILRSSILRFFFLPLSSPLLFSTLCSRGARWRREERSPSRSPSPPIPSSPSKCKLLFLSLSRWSFLRSLFFFPFNLSISSQFQCPGGGALHCGAEIRRGRVQGPSSDQRHHHQRYDLSFVSF